MWLNADNLIIHNCNFLYPNCYAHMLNQINYGNNMNPLIDEIYDNQTNISSSENCTISNCSFKYTDGSVLEISGGNNTITNNYFSYIDKTVCNLSSVMTSITMNGSYNIISHNTIHKTGASSTINPGNYSIVEYNNLYNVHIC